jgi:hypothetical protein
MDNATSPVKDKSKKMVRAIKHPAVVFISSSYPIRLAKRRRGSIQWQSKPLGCNRPRW